MLMWYVATAFIGFVLGFIACYQIWTYEDRHRQWYHNKYPRAKESENE